MARTDWSADRHMSAVSAFTNLVAYGEGATIPGNPWFKLTGCSGWDVPWQLEDPDSPGVILPPMPDWSAWSGPGQSVADFLNALEETFTWYTIGAAEGVMGWAARPAYPGATSSRLIICMVADWMLPYVSGQALTGITPRRQTRPIWPGRDKVTFGDPQTFANGNAYLATPMDGVIVDINDFPSSLGHWLFGTVPSYKQAGSVVFMTEDGYYEFPQPVTFGQHILTPQTMVRAYGYRIRCPVGLVGGITPWTIDGSGLPDFA